ncbi:MAG: hypothetical protein CL401_01980 [Acidiferrobacteraceae bacterium]|nr:hypothetical protein [Acidiferrobacteraceae bacterium]|tara:strand:- start:191 stop:457 length:267 start_codon:yes stop_codon:yes gene_type:complete
MQDFLDFLSWLGFTILAAAVFGLSDVVESNGLTGPELMTLGLCASFAGGSSGFLLCRWVARGAAPLSTRIQQLVSDRQRLDASQFERA